MDTTCWGPPVPNHIHIHLVSLVSNTCTFLATERIQNVNK